MSLLDNYYFRKGRNISLFLLLIVFTWAIFSNLVDGDWGSLEKSIDNLSIFFLPFGETS